MQAAVVAASLIRGAVPGNYLGGSIAVSTARPGAPGWLSGGAFGPEASIYALILGSAVTAGALLLVRKRRSGSDEQASLTVNV